MTQLITRQLLFDFFDGKTTSIQRKLVEQWLTDTKNEEQYYGYLDEWEKEHPQFMPDLDRCRQAYNQLLDGGIMPEKMPEVLPEVTENTNLKQMSVWLAAACALLILGFVFRSELMFRSYSSESGCTSSFFLTDGTKVTLNSNSSLRVPRFGFGKDVRQVWLDGEAEFKVTHTKNDLRFRVLMGDDFQIEVLGTEFNAFSRARGKSVFLTKGKVKVNMPEGREVYLKPGNYLTADNKGGFKVSLPREPLAIVAWKDQAFYFDNTPLSEVAEQINERFNVNIKIKDHELAAKRVGGIYQADQADSLLEILSSLFEIEITRKSDCIELRPTKLHEL